MHVPEIAERVRDLLDELEGVDAMKITGALAYVMVANAYHGLRIADRPPTPDDLRELLHAAIDDVIAVAARDGFLAPRRQ